MKLRIRVDLNTMMVGENWIALPMWPPRSDYPVDQIVPGLLVTIYDPDYLEVDATVKEFDANVGCWFGKVDWSTRLDYPDSE